MKKNEDIRKDIIKLVDELKKVLTKLNSNSGENIKLNRRKNEIEAELLSLEEELCLSDEEEDDGDDII